MASQGSAEQKRQKAQQHFEKSEERRREAAKAVAEQNALKNAEAAKTARLRALRLAKEEADALAMKEKSAQAGKKTAIAGPAGPRRQKPLRKTPPADA